MKVIVFEEWNGRNISSEYHFDSTTEKEEFIKFCKKTLSNCLIIEYNNKVVQEAI